MKFTRTVLVVAGLILAFVALASGNPAGPSTTTTITSAKPMAGATTKPRGNNKTTTTTTPSGKVAGSGKTVTTAPGTKMNPPQATTKKA